MTQSQQGVQQSVQNRGRIVGVGSALPDNCVTNQQLADQLAAKGVETSDQWIIERTGIRQRYIADSATNSSDLAAAAARKALSHAGLQADAIDLIIVATSTPDVIFPSTACIVQHKLGVPAGAACFDVQAVCSGFVYGLGVANSMIASGMARNALVIGAEVFSRILDWNDRGTCVLFGDGAGAVVLTATSANTGIMACSLHADGSQMPILCTAGTIANGVVTGHPYLTMNGPAVFKLAVNVLESSARTVAHKAGVELSSVDWLIPHQANVRILEATGKKLGLPRERLVVTVDQHANTSAASVPLALNDYVQSGRIKPGQRLLLQGVGGGFTWGAALVDF